MGQVGPVRLTHDSRSGQAENEAQDQEAEIKGLPVVEDDGQPVAAVPV